MTYMFVDEVATDRLVVGLVRLAAALHAAVNPDHRTGPRTLAEQQVLLVLSGQPGAQRLSQLAARLGMTLPDTLAIVSGLVEAGLVAMLPAPSYSPTEVAVGLSDAGRDLPPELLSWAGQLLRQLDDQDEEEQRRLLGVVTARIGTLQRQGRIPVADMCLTCRFFRPYEHAGQSQPHHCALVDAAFGHVQLRLHCPEQQPGISDPPGAHTA